MTLLRLIFRTMRHFAAADAAVVAGIAIATAILTGALLVGDCVRGSLRDLALRRLGDVDYALAAAHFFPGSTADAITGAPAYSSRFAPARALVQLRGGAGNESGTRRTAGVQIFASPAVPVPRGGATIGPELARSLGIAPGETLLLTLPVIADSPRDATLARRGREDTVGGMRARVASVAAPDSFESLFSLAPSQRTPLNVWLNPLDVQDAISQPGKVNALLVSDRDRGSNPQGAAALDAALKSVATLDTFGLNRGPSADSTWAVFGSSTTYLSGPVLAAALDAAHATGTRATQVSTYLINRASVEGTESALHYAIGAGVSDIEGKPLAPDEIVLNQWAADHLGAKPGDRIRLSYYVRRDDGELTDSAAPRTFRVSRILPMTGLGADPTLTPTYKGLTDTDAVADWREPEGLKINRKLVTPDDEAYWKKYRAAPKLFVSIESASEMWGNAFGTINSVRVPTSSADAFARELLSRLTPRDAGLVFVSVRSQQLVAAATGTDFGQLFLALSFFLIASAALLVAMLLRLAFEQRARQFGLLAAVGFAPARLRSLALVEGMLLAVVGVGIGTPLAVAYTALVVHGLRTWWFAAVGTSELYLHVSALTLGIGAASSLLVVMLSVGWAVRGLAKAQAATLLAGGWSLPRASQRPGRLAPALAMLSLLAACGAVVLPRFGVMPRDEAYLLAGGAMLVALLARFAMLLIPRRRTHSVSLGRLAWSNARRRRGRSVLVASLIAIASFVLVLVSSMRQGGRIDSRIGSGPTGGYQLMVRTDLPMLGNLSASDGRKLLGVVDQSSPLWGRARFTMLRSWAGQDASCLNLTRPTAPTIFGLPPQFIARGGFGDVPWNLLSAPVKDDDPIPVIADAETAQYILHLGVGQTIPISDQMHRPRLLRLIATVPHSIFQGQLLMSEAHFLRLFPGQGGYGAALVECPPGDEGPLRQLLSQELADYAAAVDSTPQILSTYQQVANTYLSTFGVLGSLGLLLGTAGLAVVLLRSMVERRGELALLSALGFGPRRVAALVLAENAILLVAGLIVGSLSAVIAIAPTGRPIAWAPAAASLGAVLAAGLMSLLMAVWIGGAATSSAALRRE